MRLKSILKNKMAAFILITALQPLAFAGLSKSSTPDLNREVTMAAAIYDGMELLDYAGPKEVFSAASKLLAYKNHKGGFKVVTVAKSLAPITASDGTVITPDYTFETVPNTEVIYVPGGAPARADLPIDAPLVVWLKQKQAQSKPIFMSVCTGAFFLGKAGLFENKNVTTHHMSTTELQDSFPNAHVLTSRRYVADGSLLTTAGVSAGMDGALYLTSKFFGDDLANDTTDLMEYTWNKDLNNP